MKVTNKVNKLILIAILVLFPFAKSFASNQISVPIYVEWTYGGQKWDNSPHFSNVLIEPLNDAPNPSVSSFDYQGNYIVEFSQPNFTKTGKYEYLIYQTNEDFVEGNRTVRYDKISYRLVFSLHKNGKGLSTSVYAYDNRDYGLKDKWSKKANIRFVNEDPFLHNKNGDILDKNMASDIDNANRDKENIPTFTTDNSKTEIVGRREISKDNDKDKLKSTKKPLPFNNYGDKKANSNVKTGIESLDLQLVLLVLAISALFFTRKNKYNVNSRELL